MVGHRRMTQQLRHAITMLVRRFHEETPELATLRVKYAELECDSQEGRQCFEAVILVRFRKVLWRALQRLQRATVVLARRVNRAHDCLIAADELIDVHLRNEVDGGYRVVSRRVGAE